MVHEAEGAAVVAAAATAAGESLADAVALEAPVAQADSAEPVAEVALAADAVALLVAVAGVATTLSTSMTTAPSPRLAPNRARAHNTPGPTGAKATHVALAE